MAKNNLERRTFLKMCGSAALGSAILPPEQLLPGDAEREKERFRLSKPRWIIYENGSYDLISNEIILKNCRPSINDQTVTPRNVFLGDSPKGNRIVYELPGGFVMLDLQTHEDSLAIGVEFSGFSQTPRWFFPISQAQVFGADRFFRQGFGTGGPSGVFPIVKPSQINTREIGPWQNWSYDSYLSFAFLGKTETIAIGNTDHNDFLQRSTIYCHRHRQRLQDSEEGDGHIFFEAAMLLNQTKIDNEYVKLPNLFFYTGNKPFETLQELTWRTSKRTRARQTSLTSYHWISKADTQKPYSFDQLKKQVDFLEQLDPPLPVQTLTINKGYCTIGDWLEPNENWPGGLDRAAREIFKNGYRAGIWIAPFMVDKNSNLYKKHRDWVIKDFNNQPIPEKSDEPGIFYALDASHNGVKRYIREVFGTLRKIGFISYNLAYLEWGIKDSYLVKKDSPGNSSVQDFRDILGIIREEIGHGSLITADQTAYSPLIGFADYVKLVTPTLNGWKADGVEAIIRESYFSQYFNNTLWQNNPGEIELNNDSLTEDEKMSLALWIAFLGGTVGSSDNFNDWSAQKLEFFRFLEPAKRYQNAWFPYWPSEEEIKVAVRRYRNLRGWGVLFFNDQNVTVIKNFPILDFTEQESAFVFGWEPGTFIPFGPMKDILVSLQPHQSRLFWLSEGNEPPPSNVTLGGKAGKEDFLSAGEEKNHGE